MGGETQGGGNTGISQYLLQSNNVRSVCLVQREQAKRHPSCRFFRLNSAEMGARMRLQVGFTLATIFLALFTAALWKERAGRERGR